MRAIHHPDGTMTTITTLLLNLPFVLFIAGVPVLLVALRRA
jgi:hypothetical protein